MQCIKEWLVGKKSYAAGVVLYETYGDNGALKEMFRQGESSYRKDRLVNELKAIAQNSQQITIEVKTEAEPVTVVVERAASKHDMPEVKVKPEQDPYLNEWKKPYAEMQHLRHTLIHAPNDVERGVMAFRILELERQCMAIWAKRDYYLKYGQKPSEEVAPEDAPVTDVNALTRLLLNARSCLSKAKKKLEKTPSDHAAAGRVERYAKKVKELENLLGL